MELLQRISKSLGFGSDDEHTGCRAVTDDGTLCTGPAWGRGCVDGHEIKYCESHAPSKAVEMWCSGRIGTVTFYIPEDDVTIEVE